MTSSEEEKASQAVMAKAHAVAAARRAKRGRTELMRICGGVLWGDWAQRVSSLIADLPARTQALFAFFPVFP